MTELGPQGSTRPQKTGDRMTDADQPDDRRVLVDTLAGDGTIRGCDAEQAQLLGYDVAELIGQPMSRIYLQGTCDHLQQLLRSPPPGQVPRALELRHRDGRTFHALAIVGGHRAPDGTPLLQLSKWLRAPAALSPPQAEELAILADIVACSADPGWCIEFDEPVDLSAPEQEIVRQIFGNRRRWRLCNAAMGRFYGLPDGEDLNDRPVSEVFGRNPENESFALELIRNGFDVARALSYDTRYDGTTVPVENDVRGHIRDNRLYRMWGTVRDVTQHLHRVQALRKRIAGLEQMLAAVPDPLLVVDAAGIVAHANLAAEALFALPPDCIGEQPFDRLVGPEAQARVLAGLLERSATGRLRAPIRTEIRTADGPIAAELNAARLSLDGEAWITITLRRVAAHPAEALGQGAA